MKVKRGWCRVEEMGKVVAVRGGDVGKGEVRGVL